MGLFFDCKTLKIKMLYTKPTSSGIYNAVNQMAIYLDKWAAGCGAQKIIVDQNRLHELVAEMQFAVDNFPHKDGFDAASPFKKAGYFFVSFIAISPIVGLKFEPNLNANSQRIEYSSRQWNVMVAYALVVDFLINATIQRTDGVSLKLTNRIKVSHHFYSETIEAFRDATPQTHYKVASLFFESLAYRVNPDVSYPLDF